MNPLQRMTRCAVLLIPIVLAGCSSTPTRYYTLQGPMAPTEATAATYAIEVLPVSVPAQVDTQPLVLRAGDGRLAINDSHEWAAPLPDEIHQALSQDLTQALGAEDVYGLSHADTQPVYRIKLVVTRFDSTYGHAAEIQARWSVRALAKRQEAPLKEAPLTCSSREVQTVTPGYDALVQGHQRALAALAGEIAAGVRSMSAGAPRCPSRH